MSSKSSYIATICKPIYNQMKETLLNSKGFIWPRFRPDLTQGYFDLESHSQIKSHLRLDPHSKILLILKTEFILNLYWN